MSSNITDTEVCAYGRDPGDTSWLISCGVLVLTMQGGFALLESGSVRLNNTVNILVKNLADLLLGGMAYWMLGWGFAYGESAGGFIGTTQFFADEYLDYAAWFFQLSFAATASTIDSGACAERMKLWVYFGLSFWMTLFTYPVATHWVWHPQGWLNTLGYIDLAGVSVVHLLGGASALVCSFMLGPRMGKLNYPIPEELKCVEKQLELSHKVFAGESVHVLYGSMLLLFGWIGFNAGSSLGLTNGGHIVAAHAAFTTTLGVCFGGSAGSAFGLWRSKVMKPGTIGVAVLSGLVAVTGGAHVINAWEAGVLGAVGAIAAVFSMELLPKLNIDDVVGVLPVHLVSAMVGTVGIGFFAHETRCGGTEVAYAGLFYSLNFKLLGIQLLGAISILVWSMFWTYLYLKGLLLCGFSIRVNPLEEMVGLDVIEHATDKFKQFKHMTDMQSMMARINPSRSKVLSEHVTSQLSQVGDKKSRSEKRGRVAPAEGGNENTKEGRRLARHKSNVRSTMLALAKGDNLEALSFISADLSNLTDDPSGGEDILRSTIISEHTDDMIGPSASGQSSYIDLSGNAEALISGNKEILNSILAEKHDDATPSQDSANIIGQLVASKYQDPENLLLDNNDGNPEPLPSHEDAQTKTKDLETQAEVNGGDLETPPSVADAPPEIKIKKKKKKKKNRAQVEDSLEQTIPDDQVTGDDQQRGEITENEPQAREPSAGASE